MGYIYIYIYIHILYIYIYIYLIKTWSWDKSEGYVVKIRNGKKNTYNWIRKF